MAGDIKIKGERKEKMILSIITTKHEVFSKYRFLKKEMIFNMRRKKCALD
jgi:hypothetical protein